MQLICPSCSARYRIAADRWPVHAAADGVPAPRPTRARCKACGHLWLALPEPAPAAGLRHEPAALRAPLAETVPDEARLQRWRWPWLAGAAAALLLAIWASAVSGQWRPQDFGLPPAAVPDLSGTMAAMAGVGIAVDRLRLPDIRVPDIRLPDIRVPDIRVPEAATPPLSVEAAAVTRRVPGGGIIWEVRGAVTNPGATSQPVPPLELALSAADGREVGRWIVRAGAERLPPGGSIAFATTAINPPDDAQMLAVRLRPASVARR